jgi:hypothetical protein
LLSKPETALLTKPGTAMPLKPVAVLLLKPEATLPLKPEAALPLRPEAAFALYMEFLSSPLHSSRLPPRCMSFILLQVLMQATQSCSYSGKASSVDLPFIK